MDKKKRYQWIFYSLVIASVLFALGAGYFHFAYDKVQITGSSMTPTLKENQVGYVHKTSWAKAHIKRLDIVVLEMEEHAIIKRVIAFGGETIQIDENGDITIQNSKETFLLDQSFLEEGEKAYTCSNKGYSSHACGQSYLVPEDTLFVLGDHRSVSLDSESKYGAIERSKLVGVWAF